MRNRLRWLVIIGGSCFLILFAAYLYMTPSNYFEYLNSEGANISENDEVFRFQVYDENGSVLFTSPNLSWSFLVEWGFVVDGVFQYDNEFWNAWLDYYGFKTKEGVLYCVEWDVDY